MKYSPVILLTICCCSVLFANAQNTAIEKEIRQLEQTLCKVIVSHDTATLYKFWAEDLTVNSPTNDVVKLEAAKYAIRNGLIDYSLFESNLEEIMVFKNMVITMGSERIKPIRNAPMAGQTLSRRYTHVWMKKKWGMETDCPACQHCTTVDTFSIHL